MRDKAQFVRGFIPNSIFIGLDGSFAPWVGELVPDLKQPILLIVEEGREAEATERLSRVGYDQVLGYLEGGAGGLARLRWRGRYDRDHQCRNFRPAPANGGSPYGVLDVRKSTEYAGGHLAKSMNIPLNELSKRQNRAE